MLKEVIQRASIVARKAETNVLLYAERGRIVLRMLPEKVTIEARDTGHGMPRLN